MTRQEIVDRITPVLDKIKPDDKVDIDQQAGSVSFPSAEDPTFSDHEVNGSYTITIKVNGGAHDTKRDKA
jgi:hypothetical protein